MASSLVVLDHGAVNGAGSPASTNSISPTLGKFLIVFVHSVTGTGFPMGTPTLSGCGGTWTSPGAMPYDTSGTGQGRIDVFTCADAAFSGVLSIAYDTAGGFTAPDNLEWSVIEATQVSGVVQFVSASGATANPSVALAALANAANISIGGLASEAATSTAAITAGAGFTELSVDSQTTAQPCATEVEYQVGATTVNWTRPGTNSWGAVALELATADVYIDRAVIGTPVAVNAGSTTLAFVTNVAVAAGATILLGISSDGAGFPQSVSGGGLTWAVDKRAQNGTSTDWSAVASAYAPAGLASGTTITITWSGSVTGRQASGSSFLAASQLVVDGTPVSATQSTAGWSSGNYVTSAAAVIFAASETDTNTTSTPTTPAVEASDFQEPTSGNTLTTAFRLQPAAGTFAVAGTWAGAAQGVVSAVAYKMSVGAVVPEVAGTASVPMRSH